MRAIWRDTVLAESDETIVVEGNAAWYYPEPKEAAAQIRNYVASWRGVKAEE